MFYVSLIEIEVKKSFIKIFIILSLLEFILASEVSLDALLKVKTNIVSWIIII